MVLSSITTWRSAALCYVYTILWGEIGGAEQRAFLGYQWKSGLACLHTCTCSVVGEGNGVALHTILIPGKYSDDNTLFISVRFSVADMAYK